MSVIVRVYLNNVTVDGDPTVLPVINGGGVRHGWDFHEKERHTAWRRHQGS